mgnify:CR=1 FL=1
MKFNYLSTILYQKSQHGIIRMCWLALLAGLYISLGAILYSFISNLNPSNNMYRLFGSLAFCVGLILVIFLKAQLFTGNNLLFINLFNKMNSLKDVLRNWFFVYVGNFLGAILFVFIFLQFINNNELKTFLIQVSEKKTSYPFYMAYLKAILCNILVCIGVINGVCFHKLYQKIIGIIIPITLFVYLGFEHSIANMFFVPIGILLQDLDSKMGLYLFFKNIIPVSLGNITGALILSVLIHVYKKSGLNKTT